MRPDLVSRYRPQVTTAADGRLAWLSAGAVAGDTTMRLRNQASGCKLGYGAQARRASFQSTAGCATATTGSQAPEDPSAICREHRGLARCDQQNTGWAETHDQTNACVVGVAFTATSIKLTIPLKQMRPSWRLFWCSAAWFLDLLQFGLARPARCPPRPQPSPAHAACGQRPRWVPYRLPLTKRPMA